MFWKKKKEYKLQLQEFYPCSKESCRFRTKWHRVIDKYGFKAKFTLIIDRTETVNILSNSGWISIITWCLSCKYFEQQNHYQEKL